jgi:hypothetical protein
VAHLQRWNELPARRRIAVPEDAVTSWALVYSHLAYQDPVAAIAWLSTAFGFRERARMEDEDGSFITAKLETLRVA